MRTLNSEDAHRALAHVMRQLSLLEHEVNRLEFGGKVKPLFLPDAPKVYSQNYRGPTATILPFKPRQAVTVAETFPTLGTDLEYGDDDGVTL